MERILGSHIFDKLENNIAIYFNKIQGLENLNYSNYFNKNFNINKDCKRLTNKNLAVQPNHRIIFLSSFEYNLLNKHAEHLDQQMGAGHYLLGNKDVKIMKNCTIILIGCMTLALKVLAMFTLSMGTLILKSTILIYGWLPAHILRKAEVCPRDAERQKKN